MRLLLDTHILLWAASDPGRLTPEARDILGDPATEFLFSTASIWEVVIKKALGRRDFHVESRRFRDGLIQNGYSELAIRSEHTLAAGLLPPIHKDLFDRMLVEQAQVENIRLLTMDNKLSRYFGPVKVV